MFRSPSFAGLPGIDVMLDDIAAPRDTIAAHLGIAPSTLATYQRNGNAPRSVMLALFWETRWGRSAADCEAANFGRVHYLQAKAMQAHIGRLAGIIWRLEMDLSRNAAQIGGAVPANLPVFMVG